MKNNKNSASIIPREPPGGSNQINKVGNTITTTFPIEGMTCLSCARKIEETLSGHAGVKKAQVNFGRRETRINYNQDKVSPDDLMAVVQALGYRLIQKQAGDLEEPKARSKNWIGLKSYLFGAVAAIGIVGFYLCTVPDRSR